MRTLRSISLLLLFSFIQIVILQAEWTQKSLPSGGIVTCLAVMENNLFAGTSNGGIFISTNDGDSWTSVNSGLTNMYVSSLTASGTNLFAVTGGGGICLSIDSGGCWTTIHPESTSKFVRNLLVNGMNLYAASDSGVLLSTNYGTSWTAIDSGISDIYVRALTLVPNGTGGTNLLAGSNSVHPDPFGGICGYTTGDLFISTNDGTSWTSIYHYLYGFTSLLSIPNGIGCTNLLATANIADCGYLPGVLVSTNNGTSWTVLQNGWECAFTFIPDGIGGAHLFAGSSEGVYLVTNNCTTWTAIDSGLTNPAIHSIAIKGTYLIVGTESSAIWIRPLSEVVTGVEDEKREMPHIFSLYQNYPNPFNPSTTISFFLPSKGFVTLKVFDALGREIITIVSQELSAGTHFRNWNANNLSSGNYFYRLQTGSFMETKKLVLLR